MEKSKNVRLTISDLKARSISWTEPGVFSSRRIVRRRYELSVAFILGVNSRGILRRTSKNVRLTISDLKARGISWTEPGVFSSRRIVRRRYELYVAFILGVNPRGILRRTSKTHIL